MAFTKYIPVYLNKSMILDYLSVIGEGYIDSLTIKHSNDNNGSIEIENDNREQNTSEDKLKSTSCDLSNEYCIKLGLKDECDKKKIYSTFYYFIKLKNILNKNKMLKNINEIDIGQENIREGEFVEFTSYLTNKSVLQKILTIIDILNSYDTKALDNLIKGNIDGFTNYTVILNQLKNLSVILNRNNTNDIVMELGSLSVVLSLNTNNFTDKNAYIYDTQGYEVKTLCKVVKVCSKDFYIDLLRKTADTKYYNSLLNSYTTYFKILNDNNIIMPKNIITKINGPALCCIPLAIYL